MSTQRYYVVKARVKPRIYAAHAYGRSFGFVVTEWTDDERKARTFGLKEAVAVARRNAHCITVVKR